MTHELIVSEGQGRSLAAEVRRMRVRGHEVSAPAARVLGVLEGVQPAVAAATCTCLCGAWVAADVHGIGYVGNGALQACVGTETLPREGCEERQERVGDA